MDDRKRSTFHAAPRTELRSGAVVSRSTQEGNVLLLSLLMLGIFVFVGLAWATLVIRNLRSVTKIDEAMIAFSAAETAIEDGLFQLRKQGVNAMYLELSTGALTNGATWKRRIFDRRSVIILPTLEAEEVYTLDLYNADHVTHGVAPGADAVRVQWQHSGNETPSVTLRIARWDAATSSFDPEDVCADVSSDAETLLCVQPTVPEAYRVRLETNRRIRNVRIDVFNDETSFETLVSIPQPLTIESTGIYRSAKQALRVTWPQMKPW